MSVSIVKVCVCLTLIAALTTETKINVEQAFYDHVATTLTLKPTALLNHEKFPINVLVSSDKPYVFHLEGLFMLRPARSRNAGIEDRNPSDQIGKYMKKYYPYTAPRGRKRATELNRMKYNPYTAPRGGKRTAELHQMGYKSYLPEEEKRAFFLRTGQSTAATQSESDGGFFVFPRLGRAMSFAFPRLGRANQIHEELCCNGYCMSPARCCDGFIEGKTNSEDLPFVICYPAVNGMPSEIMGN